jgi:hypothetical protein
MHVEHGVDRLRGGVDDRGVAQDAGVVHDDVDAIELVQAGLHHRLGAFGAGDAVVVRDGDASGGSDLVDDGRGARGRGAAAVHRGPEIVDHDGGAARREEQRVGPLTKLSATRLTPAGASASIANTPDSRLGILSAASVPDD